MDTRGMSEAELIATVAGKCGEAAIDLDAWIRRAAHKRGGKTARRLLAAVELGRRTLTRNATAGRAPWQKPQDFAPLMQARTAGLRHEEFWIVLLDARLRFVTDARIATGGLTQCSVLPREVFAPLMVRGLPALATFHNHPSGDPSPSPDDQRLWMMLDDAGRALGIRVIDHFVVAAGGVYSQRTGHLSEPFAKAG